MFKYVIALFQYYVNQLLHKEKFLKQTLLFSTEIKWKQMGPPNRRNYEYIANDSDLPPKLKKFISVLKSKTFFSCLDQYTGLELRKMKWEFQKWTPGSYSLITQDNADRLDVMFCVGDTSIVGGKTHYVTLDDEVQNALITTGCEVNYLNLVYGDTARYTSLISKYSKTSSFYMFVASYFEDSEEKSKNKEVVDLNTSSDLNAKVEDDKTAPAATVSTDGAGDNLSKENNVESKTMLNDTIEPATSEPPKTE